MIKVTVIVETEDSGSSLRIETTASDSSCNHRFYASQATQLAGKAIVQAQDAMPESWKELSA